MNAKKFSDAMSELDNKYIDEALNYKKKVKKQMCIRDRTRAAKFFLRKTIYCTSTRKMTAMN